jgi:hypothetical protein
MSYDLACLSSASIATPFEVCAPFHYFRLLLLTVPKPDPHAYDSSTVADPSSLLVQVMREQEDSFFAIFPEARMASEYCKRKNEAYLTALHSVYALGHQESTQLNHQPYQAAYHSSFDHSLGQQPQDIVSEAISNVPPTLVSQPLSKMPEKYPLYYSSSIISVSPFRNLTLKSPDTNRNRSHHIIATPDLCPTAANHVRKALVWDAA